MATARNKADSVQPKDPTMHADSDSSGDYFAIVPSDSVNFLNVVRAIYVGVTGHVVAVRPDGMAVTFKNVLQGTILRVYAKRVNSTSTTATDLVGLP